MRTIIPRKLMFVTFSQDSSLPFRFQAALFFLFSSKLVSLADPPEKFKQLRKTAAHPSEGPSDGGQNRSPSLACLRVFAPSEGMWCFSGAKRCKASSANWKPPVQVKCTLMTQCFLIHS